jgi:hypothetical protein
VTFKVLSDEAFLTELLVILFQPGRLKKGLNYNYFTVIRKDGSEENYNIVTNVN